MKNERINQLSEEATAAYDIAAASVDEDAEDEQYYYDITVAVKKGANTDDKIYSFTQEGIDIFALKYLIENLPDITTKADWRTFQEKKREADSKKEDAEMMKKINFAKKLKKTRK